MNPRDRAKIIANKILSGFSWTSKCDGIPDEFVSGIVEEALREAEANGIEKSAHELNAASDRILQLQKLLIENRPDGHVHSVPLDGRAHHESEKCWCTPELKEDFRDRGGKKLYLHREIQ